MHWIVLLNVSTNFDIWTLFGASRFCTPHCFRHPVYLWNIFLKEYFYFKLKKDSIIVNEIYPLILKKLPSEFRKVLSTFFVISVTGHFRAHISTSLISIFRDVLAGGMHILNGQIIFLSIKFLSGERAILPLVWPRYIWRKADCLVN